MKIDEILERKRERHKKLNRNLNRIVKDLINLGEKRYICLVPLQGETSMNLVTLIYLLLFLNVKNLKYFLI